MRARFNYPSEAFTTLPSYSEHAGQIVTVLGLTAGQEDPTGEVVERMFDILADDGWTGAAYESELEFVSNNRP